MRKNILINGIRFLMVLTLAICTFGITAPASASNTPEINIIDEINGKSIVDGDITPAIDDSTDFGDVATDETKNFYYDICNDGTANLHLTSTPRVEITGGADFSITVQPPDNIIAFDICTYFRVTFAPTTLGIQTASISISNDDSNEDPYNFDVTGNGISPAPEMDIQDERNQTSIVDGDTTPSLDDSTDFGDVATGYTKRFSYDICNQGITNLHLSGTPLVELTGAADFSVTSEPGNSIEPANCASFEITFAPTTLGAQTATVNIANNDADENPYNFDITGNGVIPAPEMDIHNDSQQISIADGDTTPSLDDGTDFGEIGIGDTSTLSYDICNNGSGDLHLSGTPSVELSGTTNFSIAAYPSSVISLSDCASLQIAFTPQTANTQSTTVSIANDDADENPYTFVIQGKGISPDSYENDNDFSSAKVISAGIPQSHNLMPAGDLDYMTFTLAAKSAVTIQTSGTDPNGDTILRLYNSSHNLITSNDDSGNNLYSLITRTCDTDALPAGKYYVRVEEFSSNMLGDYTISFAQTSCNLPTTVTLKSTGAQDGWVLESSETSNVGGALNSSAGTLNLGDDAAKKQYRGILSFSTASLPDKAVITGVTLKVKKSATVGGGNPLTTFQGFMVDIKQGFFGTSALQITDFQTLASHTYGPFSPALVSGWYSINLTPGKAYINKLSTNGGLTQIRLRFKLDDNNNAVANYLSFFSGDTSITANRPQLVITYYVP